MEDLEKQLLHTNPAECQSQAGIGPSAYHPKEAQWWARRILLHGGQMEDSKQEPFLTKPGE